MLKLIFLIIFLAGCTPRDVQIIEDIVEGEVKTGEKVLEDWSGVPPHQ